MRTQSALPAIILACAVAPANARTPNVIVFYADDLGIGDVGCYGCKDIATPNIDALARSGVRFTNYYAPAPVCSPSRAALLTGRSPARAGVPNNVGSHPGDSGLPTEEITFAELARTRSYATALIGKWHQGFRPGMQPNDQGFDYFLGHHAGCIDYYSHMFYWDPPYHHDLYRNREEIHAEGQYMTDLIAAEASRFVDEHRDRPFLMYVAFNAPHYPLQAPQRLRDRYADLKEPRRSYAAVLTGMDEAIGKIQERIRDAGLERDTLTIFASDNGASTEIRNGGPAGSNAPYRSYKFSLFEGGIHVPCVVNWPGTIPAGETRDQLAIGMDVFPTIADAIAADPPADRKLDGRSWLPMLKDHEAGGHQALFWSSGGQDAVRRGKWKLVRNGSLPGPVKPTRLQDKDAVFLSDLQGDPGESRNLRRAHPEMVTELLRLLDGWKADAVPAANTTTAAH